MKKLLFKQQRLLNKLNEDNMQLTQNYKNCYSEDHRSNLIKIKNKSKNINQTLADHCVKNYDIEREPNEEHL